MRVTSLAFILIGIATSSLFAQDASKLQSGVAWPPNPNPYNIQAQVYQDMIVEPGDYILEKGVPICADGRLSKAGQQASELSTILIAGQFPAAGPLAQYGGVLVGKFVDQLQKEMAHTSGSIASLLSSIGASPRYAACGTAVLVIPSGYHLSKYMYMAKDLNAPWTQGSDLPICNIEAPPYLKCPMRDGIFANTQAGNVVISTFINWARETRFVRIVLEFQPN